MEFSHFSCSVMADSLWPHRLQHIRLPCPSPTPGACSNSCPFGRWCHPTILSSVIPFSCLQSSPASGSFPMSELFASGGQNIGVSTSVSVLPTTIQDWFLLGLTGLRLDSERLYYFFLGGGGGSKITADGDCSHEIKRHLLLGKKAMTNLDSILKNKDIALSTKVHLVKAMVFPVVIMDVRVGL